MENTSDKISSFFRFEDLRIYHKAIDFVEWVNKMNLQFNELNKQAFGIPMLKSAQSIAIQIAEGSARNKSQFIYYLKMAKSSVRECVVYATIVRKLEIISDPDEEESRRHLMELTKMIGALIVSLQKSQSGNDERNRDDVDFED